MNSYYPKVPKRTRYMLVLTLLLSLIMISTGCVTNQKKEALPTAAAPTSAPTKTPATAPAATDSTKDSASAQAVLEKDKPAPDFKLKDLKGKTVKLSDYKGKYVLVNFWATWCKFCKIEIPDLIAFDQANDDIVVLAVDYMEKKDTVQSFLDKNKYKMNSLLDEDGTLGATYAVSAFPTTYLIDTKGNLVGVMQGMTDKAGLESMKKYFHEKYPQ